MEFPNRLTVTLRLRLSLGHLTDFTIRNQIKNQIMMVVMPIYSMSIKPMALQQPKLKRWPDLSNSQGREATNETWAGTTCLRLSPCPKLVL